MIAKCTRHCRTCKRVTLSMQDDDAIEGDIDFDFNTSKNPNQFGFFKLDENYLITITKIK